MDGCGCCVTQGACGLAPDAEEEAHRANLKEMDNKYFIFDKCPKIH